MTAHRLVRDYENSGLSLGERLPSLARRFSCLAGAKGLDPWSAAEFHDWILMRDENSSAWHAGHLVLNVYDKGPWEAFDAIAAVRVWNEEDRGLFAAWARFWE
jgi:hypothetical protein